MAAACDGKSEVGRLTSSETRGPDRVDGFIVDAITRRSTRSIAQ
jgi:hypothetical protein